MPPNLVGLLLGVGFLGVGAFMFGRGGVELVGVARALGGQISSVADLPGRSGPVLVDGTARKATASVTAPFSETRCLAYEYETRERAGPDDDWTTLSAGQKAVPFAVDDGTGRVRVEPESATFRLSEEYRDVGPGEDPPDRVAQYLATTEDVDARRRTMDVSVNEPDADRRQRFVERRLEAGEDVSVYGESVPKRLNRAGEGLVDAVLRAGAAMPLVVVAGDRDAPSVWWVARAPILRVVGGAALLAVAGWLVATSL